MQTLKLIAVLVLGGSLAACGNVPDIASRNAPFETLPPNNPTQAASKPTPQLQAAAFSQAAVPLSVTGIDVRVPQTLTVSEANSYYPREDIVRRGDPIGDRHAQIGAIIHDAFQRGTADMARPTPVFLEVEVLRFHSVTEKTRNSVGGVHNIVFNLTVRRASSGAALGPTRLVSADLPALGGRAAIEADRQGQTQKVRVTDFLSYTIRQELARFISA